MKSKKIMLVHDRWRPDLEKQAKVKAANTQILKREKAKGAAKAGKKRKIEKQTKSRIARLSSVFMDTIYKDERHSYGRT
jgi:hypothetical protein